MEKEKGSSPDNRQPSLDLLTKQNSGIGTANPIQGDIAISHTPTTIGFQLPSMYFEDASTAANNAYEYYKILSNNDIELMLNDCCYSCLHILREDSKTKQKYVKSMKQIKDCAPFTYEVIYSDQ